MTPADKLEVLLPCPFCGERANLHSAEDEYCAHWWIQCSVCGAVSGERLADSTPDQEFAIAAWNTRAADRAEPGQSDRLLNLRGILTEALAFVLAHAEKDEDPEKWTLTQELRRHIARAELGEAVPVEALRDFVKEVQSTADDWGLSPTRDALKGIASQLTALIAAQEKK